MTYFKNKKVLLFIWGSIVFFILDQLVLKLIPVLNFPTHYNKVTMPYVGFVNQKYNDPNYTNGYRGEIKSRYKESLKIAFFGGSTLYGGDPAIPQLIKLELEKKVNKIIEVANFGVVSHNHRQNTHNLIENYTNFKPDIVIFYGGYNDTIQTMIYDPRPGYPYNFYYTEETNPIVKFFIENTATGYLIELIGNKYDLFSLTPLQKIRAKINYMDASWKESIKNNYFDSIEVGKIFTSGMHSTHCKGHSEFRFFYQPYQVPEKMIDLHHSIRNTINTENLNGYDMSSILDDHSDQYTDIVHLTQKGNEIIANEISKTLLKDKILRKCFDN